MSSYGGQSATTTSASQPASARASGSGTSMRSRRAATAIVGVERGEPRGRALHLRGADVGVAVEDLTVEVAQVHGVVVDQHESADPHAGERSDRPGAEAPAAQHRDARAAQAPLDVVRVAQLAQVAELAREALALRRRRAARRSRPARPRRPPRAARAAPPPRCRPAPRPAPWRGARAALDRRRRAIAPRCVAPVRGVEEIDVPVVGREDLDSGPQAQARRPVRARRGWLAAPGAHVLPARNDAGVAAVAVGAAQAT